MTEGKPIVIINKNLIPTRLISLFLKIIRHNSIVNNDEKLPKVRIFNLAEKEYRNESFYL